MIMPAAAVRDLCRAIERAIMRVLLERIAEGLPTCRGALTINYHLLHCVLIMAVSRVQRGHRH